MNIVTTQDFINSRYDHVIGRNGKKAYDISANSLETRTSVEIPKTSNDLKYNELVEMNLAMLFVDVKGYTDIVKEENPKKIARIMTLYVTEMGTAIRHHGGTIVSIEGDGLLAAFNENTKDSKNACEKAVCCAVTMNTLLDYVVNKRLKDIGYNTIACRYGIDYGRIVIKRAGIRGDGNNELLYIGKATNLAVKNSNFAYDKQIIISQKVFEMLSSHYKDWNKGWEWNTRSDHKLGNVRAKYVNHWEGTKEAE